ncbi:thioredoxin-disulfide reductase [Phycisphaerales bacterium AB-hyl4]|uniref:Thioredoxin reductase n=1 Tax=Natronomicrosphaera hydrolytica TaxID=3242702 RepID=A0ABV4U6L7_9BACT
MASDAKNNGNPVEKVTIIGSGPAGWTAAIYAARANLDPIVYEGKPKQDPDLILPGGQLMLTTEVENYPGFPEGIRGPEMMDAFKKQAQRFDTRIVTEDIERCDFDKRPFELHTAAGDVVRSHTVIIATGATANWLGLESEGRLARSGGGVSACAVCDGALPIFRDQPLAVIGGGDTAMEEASYLTKFASKVYIIHRRAELRASKVMQNRVLDNPKAEMVWDTVVTHVKGDERVTGLEMKNLKTGKESTLDVKGLFLAIGHTPATQFLEGSGIELDDQGYVKLKDGFRSTTNIDGVFAAGDVADATYRQAVTAAGMGCKAAIDAERWLADNEIE